MYILFHIYSIEVLVPKIVCHRKPVIKVIGVPRKLEHLNLNFGFFKAAREDRLHYDNHTELIWQLEAPEGNRVYLELSAIDLHMNSDSTCSGDKIEIRTDPCHEPLVICNSSRTTISWPTDSQHVQIKFVTDASGTATGFKGAYYYYPINSSSESCNVYCV